MRDRKLFNNFMAGLGEIFDKEMSEILLDIYWNALENFSDKQCKEAFNKAMIQCKFFPKPVEIIELIGDGPGKLEDRAEYQASEVVWAVKHIGHYRSVQFSDLVTAAVIQQCYGGWIQLCSELNQDEEKWFRKDFVKYYRAYSNQGIAYNGHLVGYIEAANITGGYDEHIPEPLLVDGFRRQKQIELSNTGRILFTNLDNVGHEPKHDRKEIIHCTERY